MDDAPEWFRVMFEYLIQVRTKIIKEPPCVFHSNLVNGLAFSLAKLEWFRLASLFPVLRKTPWFTCISRSAAQIRVLARVFEAKNG